MKAKIAYILSRFPKLSETFILREMTEIERQGWQVALYPMILQKDPVVHPEAEAWLPRMQYFPFFSPGIMAAHVRRFIRQPGAYSRALARALWENRTSPKYLSRVIALFPKAVYAAELMEREGVNHIHSHYATHTAMVTWIIHQLTGISYSITVHSQDIFVRQEMLATKLRDAKFIVAISAYNREFLKRVVGPWVGEKIHVVHCGIRTHEYTPSEHTERKADERFEMISTGRMQPCKGYTYLVQACALLRDRGIPFRCRIIGGESRVDVGAIIAQYNLASHVQLLGPQPQEEVRRLLQTAHCYVQPSIIMPSGRMEGIPVSIMEAFATGLPVVTTNISGIPELVRPDDTGYLVPPADAAALADALAAVYADPQRAAHMALRGRALVRQEFDLERNVTQLAQLFEAHACSK